MKQELKSIECDPKCGFKVRSHDENEVMTVAKKHAKEMHKMSVSDTEMKKMMKAE